MKRKILLAALFSTTAVLAAIGLATEKSQAGGWIGDNPLWNETEITAGHPYTYEVPCTEIVGKESYYDSDGTIITTIVKQTTPRTAQGCALVSTGQCTPFLPC